MGQVASTIDCRLLCASACAYGIDTKGKYTAPQPYSDAVGWDSAHPPVPVFGAPPDEHSLDINACLVGKNVDGIVVAFRGTLPPEPLTPASLLDWLQDIFEAKPEKEGSIPGKVHHGFWNAIQTLWTDLAKQLAAFQGWYPSAPLFVTGHSKGGPMATITAAALHFDNPSMIQPHAAYTFASPRPGDTAFVAGFPQDVIPVTRYENYLDLVPMLPPTEEFIEIAEMIPLLKDLFEEAQGWDYASLGVLRYIQADHKVVPASRGLEAIRLVELATTMAEGESGFVKIGDAHSVDCGGGYMGGTCPTGVCS